VKKLQLLGFAAFQNHFSKVLGISALNKQYADFNCLKENSLAHPIVLFCALHDLNLIDLWSW